MIHYKNARYNGKPEPIVIENDRSVAQAFGALVFGEIGFGTQVTAVTPTYVACKTYFLGCVDIVEFSGSETDMLPLVRAAGYYAAIRAERHAEIGDHVLSHLPQQASGGYRPFDVVHLGSILIGHSIRAAVTLLAIGIEPTEELMKLPSEDLLAAAELHLETGVSFVEILLV